LFILAQTAWAEERCFSPSLEVRIMFSRSANIVNRVLGLPPLPRRARRQTTPQRARPAIEALEDRCLPSSYTITDIGPISTDSDVIPPRYLSGINNAAAIQVVGEAANSHAYLWSAAQGGQDLGTLGTDQYSQA
jgi:hypothetical protein